MDDWVSCAGIEAKAMHETSDSGKKQIVCIDDDEP